MKGSCVFADPALWDKRKGKLKKQEGNRPIVF